MNKQYLNRLVMDADPIAQIDLAILAGDMKELVPEFLDLAQDDKGRGQHKDNLLHTAKVVGKCPQILRVRLAAFFHDIGKPTTREFVGGKVTFYNHEWVGAALTRKIMKRLEYDADITDDVSRIVEMSGRVRGAGNWSDTAVRRFVRDAGPALDDLLTFCYNDTTSKHARTRKVVEDQVTFLRGRIAEVQKLDAKAALRPPVNGKQVMDRYGIKPGPELGRLMDLLTSDMSTEEAWRVLDTELT